jgi:hypothetical protein
MISSISCLLIVCFLEKAMLDDVTRLQFNTVETIWRPTTTNVGMEDDPDKNPAKVCWKERFILLLVRERDEDGRTGERPT